MLLLSLCLFSLVTSSNNLRPYLGKNYVPLETTNAFYSGNYCYNWKCWGTGNYSNAWIECYSISNRCSTQVNGTAGYPECEPAEEGYVTKDRLYCPERANLRDGRPAYCRCYDNDEGKAECGCTPIRQFPLTYVLVPIVIILLGGLYMLVRMLHEKRTARAEDRVPPYPPNPSNPPPGGVFDLSTVESSLVIMAGRGDLPGYVEEGSKLPEYDEVEGPPPAYPGMFVGQSNTATTMINGHYEQSNTASKEAEPPLSTTVSNTSISGNNEQSNTLMVEAPVRSDTSSSEQIMLSEYPIEELA